MPYPSGDAVFVFMRLLLNGTDYSTEAGTVGELLAGLGISPERVAVEVNMKVVSKKDYPAFGLSEGDAVEVVNFVGGG